MILRDPFTGKFATRRKYGAAIKKLARLRQRAFEEENDRELVRLTYKARRYQPLIPRRRKAVARVELKREWEFGMAYESTRKGGHDVGFNARLVFPEPVDEVQARLTLDIMLGGGDVPNVKLNAIDWARPGKRIKGSRRQSDLEAFADVAATVGVENLRAGGVKLNEL